MKNSFVIPISREFKVRQVDGSQAIGEQSGDHTFSIDASPPVVDWTWRGVYEKTGVAVGEHVLNVKS